MKSSTTATAITVDAETKKIMQKKLVLLIASSLLLLAAVIYLATAWFTKMTSVTGTEFQVAQWEFNLNHNVNTIEILVYEYENLESGYAAPGSAGYIPILLSAGESNVAVRYYITIDTSLLSGEFVERLNFYYEKVDENGDVEKDDDGNPILIQLTATAESDEDSEETYTSIEMTGTIAAGEEVEVTLYWEWPYEYEFSSPYSDEDKANILSMAQLDDSDATYDKLSDSEKSEYEAAYIEAYNEFDTQVGIYPDLYKDQMQLLIQVTGVQIEPELVSTEVETEETEETEEIEE